MWVIFYALYSCETEVNGVCLWWVGKRRVQPERATTLSQGDNDTIKATPEFKSKDVDAEQEKPEKSNN